MKTTQGAQMTEGTQDEILAELGRLEEGWRHFGNERLAVEARQALDAVTLGASSVRVGHMTFDVTET